VPQQFAGLRQTNSRCRTSTRPPITTHQSFMQSINHQAQFHSKAVILSHLLIAPICQIKPFDPTIPSRHHRLSHRKQWGVHPSQAKLPRRNVATYLEPVNKAQNKRLPHLVVIKLRSPLNVSLSLGISTSTAATGRNCKYQKVKESRQCVLFSSMPSHWASRKKERCKVAQ
jgi:hypothetical protein